MRAVATTAAVISLLVLVVPAAGGPTVALVNSFLAVGASVDLSSDPADVDGADGIADFEAFICCGGSNPTALRPLNGAGWASTGDSWDTASLGAAQGASYSTAAGGFIPSEFEVYYVKTGNNRFYKLRFPTGGTNDATGISIEWDYLGAGTIPAPTASFTFTSYDVFTSFTDTSTGTPSSWAWTFGDGESSTFRNPFHGYAGAGTFNACLTATNIGGSDGPVCQDVTITEEPSTTVAAGGAIDFDGDGSTDLQLFTPSGCSEPNAFDVINGAQWSSFSGVDYRTQDLADAQAASLSTSNFCVESGTPFEGFFVVTGSGAFVKVWVPSNTASGARFVFEVLGSTQPPPVASFTFTSYDVLASFTDTSTGDPTNWSWTFGDGGSSTAQNPFHSYSDAGTFEACLTASNGGGSDGPVCQDVTITEESSITIGPDGTIDFDGDGTVDLQVDPTTDCGGNPPNRFLVLNGAQWSGFSADYRTLDLDDVAGAFFGTSPFCVEAGTPFEGFFVLTGSGTYVKVWVPSNTAGGVRFIFEELGQALAATATCAADGSATVEITSGDGPFDIDHVRDGAAQPQLSGVGAGNHALAGDDLGPNGYTDIVVTETGGDGEVLDVADVECNVPLQATAECDGADLTVTITSGDADFSITATLPGGFADTVSALGTTTYPGPDAWVGLEVTEVGGDDTTALGDITCDAPTTTTTTTVAPTTTTVAPTTTTGATTTTTTGATTTSTLPATPPAGNLALTVSDTTPTPGQEIQISASGFNPNEQIEVVIYPTPLLLDVATTDGNGDLATSIVIPVGITLGDHVIAAFGATDIATADITVIAASSVSTTSTTVPGGTLPSTGTDAIGVATMIGMALLAAGLLLARRPNPRTANERGQEPTERQAGP